jgi:hypothetical protein
MAANFKMVTKGIFNILLQENGWMNFQSLFGFEFSILLTSNCRRTFFLKNLNGGEFQNGD